MNTQPIEELYGKCVAGSATAEERREVLAWLALPENEETARKWLLHAVQQNDQQLSFENNKAESMMQAIFDSEKWSAHRGKISRIRWIKYAAAIILLICGSIYLYTNVGEKHLSSARSLAVKDIAPGHHGAILTLDNGRKIVLDSVVGETINLENGTRALLQNGALIYNTAQTDVSGFNTMTTPRGRKFDIKLSDGTHIWLNAASSVTFPVVFNAGTRNITIKGEAYIEAAQNKKPFIVNVDGKTSVQVLGTSFNIKAYTDEENIQTTLITGSVKVTGNAGEKLLTPGQQCNFSPQGVITVSDNADIEQATAWKNGIFNFNKADIRTVMRELARWYDIDVIYSGDIPKREFKGEIGSDLSLSQVLKGLKDMKVHFEINGKTVTVMP